MIRNLLIVLAGGGVGSVARYFIQKWSFYLIPAPFPIGTFVINMIGCFLIGVFYAMAEKHNLLSEGVRLLLITGFCGGFTTFSSFALENFNLMKSGYLLLAALYIGASVVLGILATYLGTKVL